MLDGHITLPHREHNTNAFDESISLLNGLSVFCIHPANTNQQKASTFGAIRTDQAGKHGGGSKRGKALNKPLIKPNSKFYCPSVPKNYAPYKTTLPRPNKIIRTHNIDQHVLPSWQQLYPLTTRP